MLRWTSMLMALMLFAGCSSEEEATTATASFSDDFTAYDSGYWSKAEWANGSPFLNGWCADQVSFDGEVMSLQLANSACAGKSLAGGEYRSNTFYGYGRYEVRMKAASGSGVISSFFLYTGASDGNPHDEIDVEIFGYDPTKMQVNYWTNGTAHESEIALGFDASQEFHRYAIEWRSNGITWYVDDVQVHSENGSNGQLPSTPGRLMMNLWACENLDSWCGSFNSAILPLSAEYDGVAIYD